MDNNSHIEVKSFRLQDSNEAYRFSIEINTLDILQSSYIDQLLSNWSSAFKDAKGEFDPNLTFSITDLETKVVTHYAVNSIILLEILRIQQVEKKRTRRDHALKSRRNLIKSETASKVSIQTQDQLYKLNALRQIEVMDNASILTAKILLETKNGINKELAIEIPLYPEIKAI